MMRSALYALATALLLPAVAAGCGDDVVKPGDLVVNWSHGPTATCESRGVVSIKAKAYLKDQLEGQVTTPCPSTSHDGAVALNDLTPGSYTIVVAASDASGKELYVGTLEKQRVKEGSENETPTITLGKKPVQLHVTWTTPTGMCAGSPIRNVLVQYIPKAGTSGAVEDEQQVACESEFKDPNDPSGTPLAGVLFTDLEPNDDVKVFAFGLDSTGKKIAKGQTPTLILQPGDSPSVNIKLEMCPGNPPTCN